MKCVPTLLSFLILCISSSVFPMDQQLEPVYHSLTQEKQRTQTHPSKKIVQRISRDIDKKHSKWELKSPSQTMLDIVTIPQQHTPLSDELSDKLYQKNDQFRVAIELFIILAQENLNNVTATSLETIENPLLQQTTQELNELPTTMKKYIMRAAFERITHNYTMELSGHPSSIVCCDICPTTHMAAVGCKNNLIYIWDLQNISCIHMIDTKAKKIVQVVLNDKGSHVIALLNKCKTIKMWNLITEKLRLNRKNEHPINQLMSATTNNNSIIIHALSQTVLRPSARGDVRYNANITTYQIKNKKLAISNAVANENLTYYCNTIFVDKGDYFTQLPDLFENQNTLIIEKNNCRALFLCEHAIKNTQQAPDLKNIKKSESYASLTPHEKEMVDKKIQEKIKELLAPKKAPVPEIVNGIISTFQRLLDQY